MNVTVGKKKLNVKAKATGFDVLSKALDKKAVKKALAIKVNGTLKDLSEEIPVSAKVEVITFDSSEGKDLFWHSAAHVLAQAITRLYPKALPTIGPPVNEGFYYDFANLKITEEDFKKIEKEAQKIVSSGYKPERVEYKTKAEAKKAYKKNKYKVELIESFDEGSSAYRQGEFVDLCRGPHVPSTSKIGGFKLLKLAGAYWKGDAKNEQLTRIYGTAWPSKEELNDYLHRLEEAKKRDHRKIGQDLDLFMMHEYSPGAPFFLPKGTIIYRELQAFIRREYEKRGYEEVITPLMYDKALWETSGHWKHFKDDMFLLKMDGREASLKPMNCPGHCLMYQHSTKSYRDLPWRVADFAPLHRNELKGALGGITRVRKLSQDDAHIFCTPEQLEEEIIALLSFVKYVLQDTFGFDYTIELSTKPKKAMGETQLWEVAEGALKKALKKQGVTYQINPGDGAFYGPKIDFHVKDALNRSWQLSTIQLDFQMPKSFKLKFEGEDNATHAPVMIHRAILGTLERFLGVLIEHTAGKFPLWLAPEQVRVLPIADRHNTYAQSVVKELKRSGLRASTDERGESLNKKVREAQLAQVNYILVVGDKELKGKSVNIRTRANEVKGTKKVSVLAKILQQERDERQRESIL